jgi:glutathione S-transferase
MRLYHHPMSSNARRAVMTALHLGALPKCPSIELVTVDLSKGEQRAPSYLQMNPNGRVPTLDDDGFYLTESHAIMQYLAESTPGQKIYPTELRARTDVNRWLFWNAHHFQPAMSVLNWENFVKPMLGRGATDPAEVKRGEMLVGQVCTVLDAHLAGREWVSGPTLTLADLALSTPLMTTVPAKLPVAEYANIQAWFGRVQALDVWKRTAL